MVCRWQGQTTTVITDYRGGCGPPPLGIPEQESPAAPTTSEGTTKDTATEPHRLLLSLPWEQPAQLLPLLNALGNAQTLDHCPFPGTCNEEQLVQHLLWGLISRMVYRWRE